jgi:eukaryotic-like serine/threonine-protein kinase
MVSLDVEQVVMRALAKDPQQRFPGVQAFAEALERCSQSVSPKLFLPPVPVLQPTSTPQETEAVFLPRVLPATVAVSPDRATPPKPGISRRTFMRIGAGLGLVAAGGIACLVANELGHMAAQRPTSISTPTTVPTPTPLVTTILTYKGHSDYVLAVAWSPDSKYIASAGGDQFQHMSDTTVQIWDAATGALSYKYFGHTAVVRSVAWSPNKEAQTIASSDDDGRVKVWSPHSGDIYTYTGHDHNRVQALAWSPDGKSIASASFDKTVQIWDAATGGQNFTQIFTGHSKEVYAVAWSPDGKHIASAGGDQKVQIWDASNVNNVLHVFQHTSLVGAVAWSPDSRYVVSGDYNSDDAVRVWDITTGENKLTFPGKPGEQVYTVAWSPNGKYIISGGQDQTVQVWDISKESHIYTYSGHTGQVQSVVWSPDGTLIASGGFDKTIQIWTTPTARN